MENETYTRQQVITALRKGVDLVAHAANAGDSEDDPYGAILDQLTPATEKRLGSVSGPYTRKAFTDALNAAANALDPMEDPDVCETSDTIWAQDVLNLAVNAAGHVLNHPDADLHDVIAAQYAEIDVYFDDLDEGQPEPPKGSDDWNEALYQTVTGWIA